jgi:hypothetical protein
MAFQGDAFQGNAFQIDGDSNVYGTPLYDGLGTVGCRPLYYQALFSVPYLPVVAVTAPVEGWRIQSPAAPNRLTSFSSALTFVPVSLTAVNTGWASNFPDEPPVNRNVQNTNQNFVYYPVQLDNTQDISRWQQALSIAAPRPAFLGSELRPFESIVEDNNQDISKWQQPLSIAPKRPEVKLGEAFVPYNTVQVVLTQVSGWFGDLSKPVAKPSVLSESVFFPAFPYVLSPPNTVTIDKWLQELSKPAKAPYLSLTSGTVYGEPLNTVAPPVSTDVHNLPFFVSIGKLKSF